MPEQKEGRRETRTRRRIRKAAEAKGAEVIHMSFEPIGGMILMEGPSGGWSVEASHPRQPNSAVPLHACGYNADQVIEMIEETWPDRGADHA
jgi:hypothetical protein